jgi:hypothetical protein
MLLRREKDEGGSGQPGSMRPAWALIAILAVLVLVGLPRDVPATAEESEPPVETPDEFFAAAYRKHMAGDLNGAIALYRKAVAHRPTAPAIHSWGGRTPTRAE